MYRAWSTVGHQRVVQLSQRVVACILSSVLRRRIYDRCKGRRLLDDDDVCVRVRVCVCVWYGCAGRHSGGGHQDSIVRPMACPPVSLSVCQSVSSSVNPARLSLISLMIVTRCLSNLPRVDPTGLAQHVSSPPAQALAQWDLPSPVRQDRPDRPDRQDVSPSSLSLLTKPDDIASTILPSSAIILSCHPPTRSLYCPGTPHSYPSYSSA